jgi:hypothetical protein
MQLFAKIGPVTTKETGQVVVELEMSREHHITLRRKIVAPNLALEQGHVKDPISFFIIKCLGV